MTFKAKPITCDGITRSRADWSKRLGAAKQTVSTRICALGWKPCKAAVMPVRKFSKKWRINHLFAMRLRVSARNRGVKR